MRQLSELTPEQAIDLWYDCGNELSAIFNNGKIKEAKEIGAKDMLKAMLAECPDEVKKVLLWIDNEPITPFNLFPRLMNFIAEMGSEGTNDFFTSACKTEDLTASADHTENTEDKDS